MRSMICLFFRSVGSFADLLDLRFPFYCHNRVRWAVLFCFMLFAFFFVFVLLSLFLLCGI
jgi:hypothetical protein